MGKRYRQSRRKAAPAWYTWLRLAVAVVVVGGGLLGWRACDGYFDRQQAGRQPVRLIRVADGDTIVVQPVRGDEIRVRLIGIDTPELGTAASFRSALYTAEIVEQARAIELEIDPRQSRDKYGRALGWVWVTNADGAEILLQEELIRHGLAGIYRQAEGSKYFDRLLLAQRLQAPTE